MDASFFGAVAELRSPAHINDRIEIHPSGSV
jgi:hypothetical protein